MSESKTVTIYGASDDLFEVEGDFLMEADCWDAPPTPVLINGQFAFTITFTNDGEWKITDLHLPSGVEVVSFTESDNKRDGSNRHPAPLDRYPSYSDVLVIAGQIDEIVAFGQKAVAKRSVAPASR